MDTVTEEMLSEKLPRDMVNRILLYLSLSDILKKPDFRLTILDEEYMKFYASQRYKIKGDNILAKLMKHERLIHLLIPISLGIVPYFDENLEAYQLEELDPDHWAYKTADTRESVYEEGLYDEDSVGNDVINCKVLQEKYESPLKAMIKENKNVEDIIWLKFVRYYEFDEDEKDEDSDPDSPYISVLLKVHELPEELSDFGSQLAENNMYGLPPIGYKKPELNILSFEKYISQFTESERESIMYDQLKYDFREDFNYVCSVVFYHTQKVVADEEAEILGDPEFLESKLLLG